MAAKQVSLLDRLESLARDRVGGAKLPDGTSIVVVGRDELRKLIAVARAAEWDHGPATAEKRQDDCQMCRALAALEED